MAAADKEIDDLTAQVRKLSRELGDKQQELYQAKLNIENQKVSHSVRLKNCGKFDAKNLQVCAC